MNSETKLRRVLTLPWLVFYGLGVTVGAGIFALVGEILGLAGDRAPLSFLLAGIIAGATGWSYALLVPVFPKAGGEAVFVHQGLGRLAGRVAGFGVVATAIISSAVIALAFAGYMREFVPLPPALLSTVIVILLSAIAWYGIRESVMFAALITVLEVSTLLVIIVIGAPLAANPDVLQSAFAMPDTVPVASAVMAGALLAFFAFIGFEDIENMAEETVAPERNSPRAILWTLGLTVLIYVALALVAAGSPARDAVANSDAPLALLFEAITGLPGKPIAAIAAVAMVNGILVQIIMAARVLYGMGKEGLLPLFFSRLDPVRQTPSSATAIVAVTIIILASAFDLGGLAAATSLVTLGVFAMVNISLYLLGRRMPETRLWAWRWWGVFASLLCVALAGWYIVSGISGGH